MPEVVILEGMFLINTSPLKRMKTVNDYTSLLFSRFILPHFHKGVTEVHLLFDNPRNQPFNPKCSEQERRDKQAAMAFHEHKEFSPESPLPRNWREHIQCQKCKRSIVEAIGLALLHSGRTKVSQGHKVVLAGCFGGEASNTAWLVQNNAIPQSLPEYSTNAEETDLRIWRHVFKTGATRILLYSPDTDVYNIGLGLLGDINKDIVIQINLPHLDNQFLNLNGLSESLTNDPDLATIPQ